MTTIIYKNVSSAADLSADIKAIDLASQADGGKNGTQYLITLKAGATLAESADSDAINLAGSDTHTINGQGAALDGADAYRGLFAYSGAATIENLTIEKAVAEGGAGGGGGAGLGGGLLVANSSQVTLDSVFSRATRPSAARAASGAAGASAAQAAAAAASARAASGAAGPG
jgi:hypothetical protein